MNERDNYAPPWLTPLSPELTTAHAIGLFAPIMDLWSWHRTLAAIQALPTHEES